MHVPTPPMKIHLTVFAGCVRAASGQDAAAPPMSVMNCRRFIRPSELCSIQLQVGSEYFLDGLQRCLVGFLLVRDCSPALHARIAIGEALFCLTVDHYSICNFFKPTISRGLSIGKLERCFRCVLAPRLAVSVSLPHTQPASERKLRPWGRPEMF
jgi:hypothetical protein